MGARACEIGHLCGRDRVCGGWRVAGGVYKALYFIDVLQYEFIHTVQQLCSTTVLLVPRVPRAHKRPQTPKFGRHFPNFQIPRLITR